MPPFTCRNPALLVLAGAVLCSQPLGGGTYADWTALHFSPGEVSAGLASPLCDHDGDDCPNIVEYFAGSHPKAPGSAFTLAFAEDATLDEVTVQFPADPDCSDLEHVVLVSDNLVDWHEGAVFVCHDDGLRYHLNGHRYVMIGVVPRAGVFIDTDGDGLLDFFEEALISTDPDDAFGTLADILPGDDFDNDGTLNIDEPENSAGSAAGSGKPPLIPAHAVACALDSQPPAEPAALLVHTPLQ